MKLRGGTRAALALAAALAAPALAMNACSSESDVGVYVTPEASADVPVQRDAGADVWDPDACASCASLESTCAALDGGPTSCPPDLDSPDLYAWAERQVTVNGLRGPGCTSLQACPEKSFIFFGTGVDCGWAFVFDPTTKKLDAVTHYCNSGRCSGARVCLPNRCVMHAFSEMRPAICPPLPFEDGGGGCPPRIANPTVAVPAYKPYLRSASCNVTQLQDFDTNCLAPGKDAGACADWENDPNNFGCATCLVTMEPKPQWGASVAIGQGDIPPNTAGCMGFLLVEGSSRTGCGAARWAFDRCVERACRPENCAFDWRNPTPEEASELAWCRYNAARGVCKPAAELAAFACAALASDASAVDVDAACAPNGTERERMIAAARTLCGGAIADGGAD